MPLWAAREKASGWVVCRRLVEGGRGLCLPRFHPLTLIHIFESDPNFPSKLAG